MKAYLYFFEDYIELIFLMVQELNSRYKNLELLGLAARRSTVCSKIDSAGLPIKRYDWLGDLEQKWLSAPLDNDKLKKYEKLIGARNMRHLITCDRELGSGFMFGGVYASTKLRSLTKNNHEMRWRYIVGMLDYYYTTFSTECPDFVFFNEFTMSYELGAYFIAKALNIPVFCLVFSRFGELVILDDNPYNLCSPVAKTFLASKQDENVIQKEYIQLAEHYLDTFRSSPSIPGYSVLIKKKIESQKSFLILLKTLSIDIARWIAILLGLYGTKGFLRQRSGWSILATNIGSFFAVRKALSGKDFEEDSKYIGTNYIYYPLHVEPESSTMVLADKLTNQLTIIEQVAKSMPVGYKLLVKEHIPMLGMRPKGFYDKIRNMPDVHLISPFADGFSLIKNSKLVVVITGTAAWEAILLSKPAIVMGHTQYNILSQGFIHTADLVNLEAIIYNSIDLKPATKEDLVSFIAATFQEGVKMPVEVLTYSHYGKDGKRELSKYKEQIKLIVDKIINAII